MIYFLELYTHNSYRMNYCSIDHWAIQIENYEVRSSQNHTNISKFKHLNNQDISPAALSIFLLALSSNSGGTFLALTMENIRSTTTATVNGQRRGTTQKRPPMAIFNMSYCKLGIEKRTSPNSKMYLSTPKHKISTNGDARGYHMSPPWRENSKGNSPLNEICKNIWLFNCGFDAAMEKLLCEKCMCVRFVINWRWSFDVELSESIRCWMCMGVKKNCNTRLIHYFLPTG